MEQEKSAQPVTWLAYGLVEIVLGLVLWNIFAVFPFLN